MRDPETDEPAAYRLSVADVSQSQDVLLLTAIRKPYPGPAPLAAEQHRHARVTRRSGPSHARFSVEKMISLPSNF
ncbi:hypothetical protein ACFZC5_34820 [Nocardia gamkensis]|uniref:hypothetical protein n=1 Tax=Nocardia gamkensis TaxID=352869 RepID=UPI0036F12F7F